MKPKRRELLITPEDLKPSQHELQVDCVFNAGVTTLNDEILLLLRVAESPKAKQGKRGIVIMEGGQPAVKWLDREDDRYDLSDPRGVKDAKTGKTLYLTSLSHLRIARSRDGIHFQIETNPQLFPFGDMETWGIEDPRIAKVDDTYWITYTAVSPAGPAPAAMVTKDFISYERKGLILPPENKDVCLFPGKIGGRYACLHRPVPKGIGTPDIWCAFSPDGVYWGGHHRLFGVPEGWQNMKRFGAGATPFLAEEGWIEVFHAADADNRYVLGIAVFDREDPRKIIKIVEEPILQPEADFELEGFYGNVVFTCGLVERGDEIWIYYGCADTSTAVAIFDRSELEALWKLKRA